MERIKVVLYSLVIVAVFLTTASYSVGEEYIAKQIFNLVIDGDLSEWGVSEFGDWDRSEFIALKQDKDGNLPDEEDYKASAMVGWNASDPKRLYFAFQVEDDEFQDKHVNWWETDAIEIGIDAIQYGIIVSGVLGAEATEDNTKVTIKHEEVGGKHQYSYEVAIEPGDLNLKAGDVVMVALTVDDSEGGKRDNSIRWISNIAFAIDIANHGDVILDVGMVAPAAVDASGKLAVTWGILKR